MNLSRSQCGAIGAIAGAQVPSGRGIAEGKTLRASVSALTEAGIAQSLDRCRPRLSTKTLRAQFVI